MKKHYIDTESVEKLKMLCNGKSHLECIFIKKDYNDCYPYEITIKSIRKLYKKPFRLKIKDTWNNFVKSFLIK